MTDPNADVRAELSTEDIDVVGTWYHLDAFQEIFRGAGKPLGGTIMRNALLIPEPKNRHDRNAVAVHIEGSHVGYVPAEIAPRIQPVALKYERQGFRLAVLSRVWGRCEDGDWSASVRLSFSGASEPEWSYVERPSWPGNRSPDGNERLTRTGQMKQWRDAEAAGRIKDRDFDSFRPDIAQARADRDFREALRIVTKCVEAAEKRAKIEFTRPALWPTEQAATVSRSLKDYVGEVGFIERYLDADPSGRGTKALRQRLARARTLAGYSETSEQEYEAPTYLSDTTVAAARTVALSAAAEVDLDSEAADVIRDAYRETGLEIGGPLETVAVLHEHMRRADKFGGIAVYINGRRVGYLGMFQVFIVRTLFDPDDASKTLLVRCIIYAQEDPKWSARIILGPYEEIAERLRQPEEIPERPPLADNPAESNSERLVVNISTSEEMRNRLVRGKDLVEWVEPISQLRRQQRDEEALELLVECIDVAERDSRRRGWLPPSWYTEQAAIILRKRGDHAGEVALLERFIAACPPGQDHVNIKERLVKARAHLRRKG